MEMVVVDRSDPDPLNWRLVSLWTSGSNAGEFKTGSSLPVVSLAQRRFKISNVYR